MTLCNVFYRDALSAAKLLLFLIKVLRSVFSVSRVSILVIASCNALTAFIYKTEYFTDFVVVPSSPTLVISLSGVSSTNPADTVSTS